MKRKFILTSLALTFCMGMYAEQPVTVETDSDRFGGGDDPCD